MGNPFLRPLFKPILNQAARQAYKMAGSTAQFSKDAWKASQKAGEKVYKSPYFKAYVDAVAGKKGRIAQGLAIGTPIYAGSKLDNIIPTRTAETTTEEEIVEDEKGPEKKDDDLLIFDETKDITHEDIEVHEDVASTTEGSGDTQTDDQALVTQMDMFGGTTDNDSIERINGYKDVIRQIIGSGDEGAQMQSLALLLQIGSALMSGKTTDRGVQGFMEVVGNAGMQIAPTLFQMGVEKGKADREIGAAALNMYMSELDKMNNRSGPFTVVYENVYEQNPDGSMKYGKDGNPIPKGKRRVQTFYRKSPEIQMYMDLNSDLGFDKFTFVDTTATERGMDIAGITGVEGVAVFEAPAARDAHRKYAQYLKRGLDTMADFVMPLLIEQKDSLTGAGGDIGRWLGPKKALFEGITNALYNSSGGQEKFDKEFSEIQKGMVESMTVPESATYFINVGGKKVGVYLDEGNKYGKNENPVYEGGKLVDAGIPAEIITWDGMKMMLENPNRQAMITFENTLGLMLARNRQPTGRMLADVLRRSFQDSKMTGFGIAQQTSPAQVLNNYVSIFNELSRNMHAALKSALYTQDSTKGEPWIYDESGTVFNITGLDKFKNAWYGLRFSDKTNQYTGDIWGTDLYGSWVQSIGGNIQLDSSENTQSSDLIYENADKILSQ